MNQGPGEIAIINYDDEFLRNAALNLSSRIVYFSRMETLSQGVFIKDGKIIIKESNREFEIIGKDQLIILGEHNVENALAATALAWSMGLKIENIRDGLKSFTGVEHRMEVCGKVNGITFINDSKGTNPDASIKAVEAVNEPIILLAGGMDKGSDFKGLIDHFFGKVKYLILYGETAKVIEKTAHQNNFCDTKIVQNLEEAVELSFELGEKGDVILLSPACASWDMYSSYERRGAHFKALFNKIKGEFHD